MRTQPIAPNAKEPNTLDFIMSYEQGDCSEEEIVAGFQGLIDSGLAWQLQGHYGRTAEMLIQRGLCHRRLNG